MLIELPLAERSWIPLDILAFNGFIPLQIHLIKHLLDALLRRWLIPTGPPRPTILRIPSINHIFGPVKRFPPKPVPHLQFQRLLLLHLNRRRLSLGFWSIHWASYGLGILGATRNIIDQVWTHEKDLFFAWRGGAHVAESALGADVPGRQEALGHTFLWF
jgi:hypothetical protein